MGKIVFWIKNHIPVCIGITVAMVLVSVLVFVMLTGGELPVHTPTTQSTTGVDTSRTDLVTTVGFQVPSATTSQSTQGTIRNDPTQGTESVLPTENSTKTEPTKATGATEVTKATELTEATKETETTRVTQPSTQAPITAPPKPPVAQDAPLADFTIVTNSANRTLANTLANRIESKYHVCLPIEDVDAFTGNGAIYLGVEDYNSYGGYRYSIRVDKDEVSIYLNGSGNALSTAVTELVDNGLDSTEDKFPFSLGETVMGYWWNQSDTRLTSLGMTMATHEQSTLAQGVTLHTMEYSIPGDGVKKFYAVVVDAESPAKMMAVAAEWDETNSVNKPVKLYKVSEYAGQLKDDGYQVLAISNGGFFQKSAGSNLPWGVQIIDGNVRQAPNTSNSNYTDNWFGVTYDGEYVISNTRGYSAYEGRIQYAVGGGRLVMKNGAPTIPAGDPAYRTCVGLTQSGNMVLLCAEGANYAMVVQAFMDLDMDMDTVLNLDGGGSTTLHTQNGSGDLECKICGNGSKERPVADSVAIVIP